MHLDPQDTIVALSSASGLGARAIVRLSGPKAVGAALAIFSGSQSILPSQRGYYEGNLTLPEVSGPVPADLYVWPMPHSYTGQDVVELHLLASPPLVEALIAHLLEAGARAAQPGEFSMRAFLAGKLDLTRAEAVLAVIEAGDRVELKQALVQLAGGVARPLESLRTDLLDLLAEMEAGLDFTEEDIHFIEQKALLDRLAKGMAMVTLLKKQLDERSTSDRPFRMALVGKPNAGKSSLFNILGEKKAALVSPEAGTTRDYLVRKLNLHGMTMELVDTAGWQAGDHSIDQQAQSLGRAAADQADFLLLCHEAGQSLDAEEQAFMSRFSASQILAIATKCDLGSPLEGLLATSAVTQQGLDVLRTLLADRARAQSRPALAPSLSRCRHHVEASLRHLRQAHAIALNQEPPELLALELRSALNEIGEMVGAVYTDDLLDQIFSKFCIGK